MKKSEETRVALWSEAPGELDRVQEVLSRQGFQISSPDSPEDLVQLIKHRVVDLVVTWLCPSHRGALDLLDSLKAASPAPPVVVVNCSLDVGLYLEAMQRGAFDCVATPLDENELVRVVAEALENPLRLSA